MTGNLEFQYPWLLGLLALLPIYAFLRGRIGKLAALRFPSADIARAAGGAARAAAGRLLLFLRILIVALCIVALAGPRFANDHTETQASGVDIMLVLDLSWSMMALDMSGPQERVSRYDIASQVLEDFIRKRRSDRLGTDRVLRRALSGEPAHAQSRLAHREPPPPARGPYSRPGHRHRRRHRRRRQAAQGAQGQQEPHHHPADGR